MRFIYVDEGSARNMLDLAPNVECIQLYKTAKHLEWTL